MTPKLDLVYVFAFVNVIECHNRLIDYKCVSITLLPNINDTTRYGHRRRNPPGCPEMSGRAGRVAPMLLILYPESTRSFRAARRIDLCIQDAYGYDPSAHEVAYKEC